MSKLSLVLLSVLAVALVAAQDAKVVREKNNNDGSGNFDFTYGYTVYTLFCFIELYRSNKRGNIEKFTEEISKI